MARCCVFVGVILLSLSGLLRAFQCPSSQYLYSSCSTCFTVFNGSLTFSEADRSCEAGGGVLLPVSDAEHFMLLGQYLRGLNKVVDRYWIGYKFISSGNIVDANGLMAPSFVRGRISLPNTFTGDPSKYCIGFQNDSFHFINCSMNLPYLCQYTYTIPEVRLQPESDKVYVSQTQTLAATITGVGVTEVEWRLNGSSNIKNVVIPDPSTSSQFVLTARLRIEEFDPSYHPGVYEVVVVSEVGDIVAATWIVEQAVLGPFNIEPTDLGIPLGKIAAFECESNESLPLPQITWYKDSSVLNIASNNRFYVSDVSGTLFIRDVQESDVGMYHCEVTNTAGSMNSSQAQLNLVDSVERATFFIHPRSAIRLVGQPYNLECVGVQTIQPRSDTSFFDGYPISVSDIPMGIRLGSFLYPDNAGFPIYRIEAVQLNDSRECYTCQITTSPYTPLNFRVELDISTKASLTVHSIATIQELTISWNGATNTGSLQSIQQGNNVILTCHFTGVPTPSNVRWLQDGVPLTNGVFTNSSVTMVTIQNFQSSAVYQCRVENKYGYDIEGVFLCLEAIEGIPGPVTYRAQPDSNSSLLVEWDELQTPNSNPVLLTYKVYLYDVPDNSSDEPSLLMVSDPLPTFRREFIVTGLEANTEYLVEVVGVSQMGRGVANGQVSARTFPNAPTDPIPTSNITVERNNDNTRLIIQWTQFIPINATPIAIATYEIQYRVAESNDSEMVINVSGDSGLSVFRQEVEINDAASFEVRIRVKVQIQRDPPMFDTGPWSEFIEVQGVTTPLSTLVTTPATPTTIGLIPDGNGGFSKRGLLLLVVLLPIAFIAMVAVIIGTITGVVCLRRRPTKVYKVTNEQTTARTKPNPSCSSSSCDPHQRPMGTQVFDLPITNSAIQLPDWDRGTPVVTVTNHTDDAPQSTTVMGNHNNTQTTPLSPIQEYLEHQSKEKYTTFLDPHTSNNHNGVLPTKRVETHSLNHRPLTDPSLVIASPDQEVFDRLEGFSDGSSPDPQLYEISVDSAYYEKENLGDSTNSIAMTTTINATPEPLLPPDFDAI